RRRQRAGRRKPLLGGSAPPGGRMTPPKSRPVVLLVDDDENDRIFFQRAVRKTGYDWRMAMAATGREAVDYLSGAGKFADRSAHPVPTHVLLDLKLPELSGIEVLQWIRT